MVVNGGDANGGPAKNRYHCAWLQWHCCGTDAPREKEIKDKRENSGATNVWLRTVSKLNTGFDEDVSRSLRPAWLPKDLQVSALFQIDMKAKLKDHNERGQEV